MFGVLVVFCFCMLEFPKRRRPRWDCRARFAGFWVRSGEDVVEDVAVDIGEANVAAGVAVGEELVVDAELVEDSGPEVVDGGDLVDGMVAVFVGGAADAASADAASGQPEGETEGVVVASVGALGEGGSSEFAGEDDEGLVEEAAGFEVFDEAGNGLVDLVGHVAVAFFEFAVLVPGVGGAAGADAFGEAGEFDETDTLLDEPAGEEGLASVGDFFGVGIVEAVEFAGGFCFAADVADFGDDGLHAVGGFVVFDGGFDVVVTLDGGGEAAVDLVDEVEARALQGAGLAGADVGNGFWAVGLEDGGLVLGGEEAAAV